MGCYLTGSQTISHYTAANGSSANVKLGIGGSLGSKASGKQVKAAKLAVFS